MERKTMTGAFLAIDAKGDPHCVYIYTDYVEDGLGSIFAGEKKLQLSDGRDVVRVTKGEYETADGHLKLRSSEPGAV